MAPITFVDRPISKGLEVLSWATPDYAFVTVSTAKRVPVYPMAGDAVLVAAR